MATVAIAGGTGNLGRVILGQLCSSPHISSVHLLSRSSRSSSSSSPSVVHKTVDYKSKSALTAALHGCSAVINAIGTNNDHEDSKTTLVEAAAAAGVKIYVPSEFGIDPNVESEFSDHFLWKGKIAHDQWAMSLGLKVISIYIGLFMEHPSGAFLPIHGFYPEKETWYITGDGTRPLAITSKQDVGSAVAELVHLALQAPESVPQQVRIAGTNRTPKEIVDIFNRAANSKTHIKLVELNSEEAKELMVPKDTPHPPGYPEDFDWDMIYDVAYRVFRMTQEGGNLDFSERNDNELVNPGQSKWKWKTIEEYAEEVEGMPRGDIHILK